MDTDGDRHKEKMQKIKAARDKMMEQRQGEKGLVNVHTGPGKGKSSSGFGMIMRCIAHKMTCAVVQFIKGAWDTGERRLLTENFGDLCPFHALGEGFTWENPNRARDIAAARAGWEKAKELIRDPQIRMVLLDEINIALRYEYLDVEEVVAFLRDEKPEMTHVVLTGRNAAEALIEFADLVTEMTLVKHPFRSGIQARAGIAFYSPPCGFRAAARRAPRSPRPPRPPRHRARAPRRAGPPPGPRTPGSRRPASAR